MIKHVRMWRHYQAPNEYQLALKMHKIKTQDEDMLALIPKELVASLEKVFPSLIVFPGVPIRVYSGNGFEGELRLLNSSFLPK